MSSTFGRGARLRSHGEFRAVSDHGRRVSTRLLTLVARPSATGSDRLGIIASRKLGGAVVRNRAKRRLREVFRRRATDEAASSRPLDIVAIARRELVDAPLALLAADFQTALQKLRGVR